MRAGASMSRVGFLGIGKAAFLLQQPPLTQSFPSYQLEAAFRAGYLTGDFNSNSHLPRALIQELNQRYSIDLPQIISKRISFDGTIKWLLQAAASSPTANNTSSIETVLIPEQRNRNTLCLSSQIGCSLSCKFCHTGTQKFSGNLTPGQIIGQFLVGARELGDYPMMMMMMSKQIKSNPMMMGSKQHRTSNSSSTSNAGRLISLSNVVFMGQGEPLYNWNAVKEAICIFTDSSLFNMSSERITISTSGIAPLIPKVGALGVRLAISLHAPTDDLRSDIMPINKTYNISTLMEACREFQRSTHLPKVPRISFEYVMLRGFNDSVGCAKELIGLVAGMDVHVNLIPFNEWPGSNWRASCGKVIEEFKAQLESHSIRVTVRKNRGGDIMAACGQLNSSLKERAERLEGVKSQVH